MTIPSALSSSEYILLLELCEAFEEEDFKSVEPPQCSGIFDSRKAPISANLIQKGRNKEAILVVLSILESEPKDESSLLGTLLAPEQSNMIWS